MGPSTSYFISDKNKRGSGGGGGIGGVWIFNKEGCGGCQGGVCGVEEGRVKEFVNVATADLRLRFDGVGPSPQFRNTLFTYAAGCIQ